MSTWNIKSLDLTERENDFSAEFRATNVATGKAVTVTLQQMKGDPATDLIGACRALAQLLENVSTNTGHETQSPVGRLN